MTHRINTDMLRKGSASEAAAKRPAMIPPVKLITLNAQNEDAVILTPEYTSQFRSSSRAPSAMGTKCATASAIRDDKDRVCPEEAPAPFLLAEGPSPRMRAISPPRDAGSGERGSFPSDRAEGKALDSTPPNTNAEARETPIITISAIMARPSFDNLAGLRRSCPSCSERASQPHP